MEAIKHKQNQSVTVSSGQGLTEKDYSRSRKIFVVEGSLANGIVSLSSGVIISGVLKFLGAPDSINGIISGLPVCAGILLLFMPLVFGHLHRVKLTVTIFAVIHRLLFALMLSVPLIIKDNAARLYTFVIIYALGYMLGTFIGPSASNWLISLVPARIRGRYLGVREGTMIATLTVVSVVMGIVIDHMKAAGNEALGYGICTAVIFVFTVFNFICLLNIKEPPIMVNRKKINLKTVFTDPFKNKPFRKVLLLSAFWSFSFQIGGPYFSIYVYSVLGLNYTYIMLMNMLMYAVRVVAAQVWGRIADRKSWEFVTRLSLIALGVAHTGYILMNPVSYHWVFPIIQTIAGIAWGGIAISMFNLQFEFAPEENRSAYISMNTAVGSVSGFTAILLASAFVGKTGSSATVLAWLPLHSMQCLFAASGILIFLTSLYIHKFIKTDRGRDGTSS